MEKKQFANIGLTNADLTYNLVEFIAMKSTDEITYYNFSILSYLNGIEYATTNLLYDYTDELTDLSKTVTLSEAEYLKYRFKPWLLAHDVYGSQEMGFIVIMLNDILSDKEFNFRKVKLIKTTDLNTILGRILSVNTTFLNAVNYQLKEDKKNNPNTNSVW